MNRKKSLVSLMIMGILTWTQVSAAVVSGTVKDTAGAPLSGIKITDGKYIVKTDSKGRYVLPTDKANMYVFAITPDGYEPATSMSNRPKFWHLLTADAAADENVDFTLRPADPQPYRFLMLADIQLGRRINDVAFYQAKSVPDINATIAEARAEGFTPFIITLGDESWDRYWENGYGLPEIAEDEARLDCPVYNVIGNHDHDPYIAGDEHSSDTWRRLMGPNYFAFDKGGVHFVILDNIDYLNDGGEAGKMGKRNYNNTISQQQLDWLKSELADVAASTPIVVAMHVPLYNPDGSYMTSNGEALCKLLSPYKDVRVVTGHTHYSYSVHAPEGNIKENNYGAVCGSWWVTDQPDYGNNGVCRDGTPSGYAVWDVKDSELSGQYKSVGFPLDYQFRAYDGNTLESPEQNAIYVNVWGWAPGWEITVTENGKPLSTEQLTYRDPLHIISSEKPHLAKGLKNPTMASETNHFFKAISQKATTPIEITVKDNAGHTYRQVMERPKALAADMW